MVQKPSSNTKHYDFVIIGAGIIGLTLARELALRKMGRVLVLEKEPEVGRHASGRNSGVVHAGIYYSADSLKAKFCVDGGRALLEYVDAHRLPVLKCGKVIVAAKPENVATLATLLERARVNHVDARKISLQELKEIEPEARSIDYAIWSPHTAVVDSKAILRQLVDELRDLNVTIEYSQEVRAISTRDRKIATTTQSYNYGFLFNAAGVYADHIAHSMKVGLKYRVLPFKGLYWKANPDYAAKIRTLIYPAPDVRMPFLGIHITRTVDGKVLFGPTAIPAFGRENYQLLQGLDPLETPRIAWQLARMLIRNPNGFRAYVGEEMSRYRSRQFYQEAATLVQSLKAEDVGEFYKVGIRAQLMNLETAQLEMDFIVERGENSLHVLNAISPAFTCAFSFAPYLVDQLTAG